MIHYIPTAIPGMYSRDLFARMLSHVEGSYDAIYANHLRLEEMDRIKLREKLVIISIDDLPEYVDYNFWTNEPEDPVISYFKKLASRNPDKEFVLILVGNTWKDQDFYPCTNIKTVNWETFYGVEHRGIMPPDKNFDSRQIGISLSRQMRPHRFALSSYLLGSGLDEYCYISAMHLYKQFEKNNSNDILDHINWQFENRHEKYKTILSKGFQKIHQLFNTGEGFQKPVIDIYPLDKNESTVIQFTNKENFENNLSGLYKNSFVEFVGCKHHPVTKLNSDEKYINSIYGRNFPIIIGTYKTVEFFRNSGLDMFDNIVDHSYDLIENPVDRFFAAIESNKNLIKDYDQTKQLWKQNEHRFNKNVDFANNQMYDYYEAQSIRNLKEVLTK